MRVLFTMSPGLDHVYPAIGLAWALRTAGHDVLFATSGESVGAAVQAGFPVVDVSPGAQAQFDAIFPQVGAREVRAKAMRERGLAMVDSQATPEIILKKFGEVSAVMAERTLEVAKDWRPDLVVYSRLQGAGLLAARALDVLAVEHGFSFLREGDMPARFLPHLAGLFERFGVPVELPSVTSVYIAPEHMMHGQGEGLTMRFVPYHGGGELPGWLVEPKRRPRVCVTLGTTVPHVAGVGSLEGLLGAIDGVDAEFVLALGDDPELDAFGTLPDNVRVVGWTPLSTLLRSCDGIVHHGGSGTTLASAHAGVPQLVMPHGADNWINAAMIERCGLGLSREPQDVDRTVVEALLHDVDLAESVASAAADLAAQPGPDALVPRLVDLTRTTTSV